MSKARKAKRFRRGRKTGNPQISKVTVNREYKSSVFKAYFSITENCLALYNAINRTNYTEEDDLKIETLENAVYLKIYNDVSFVISGYVNLYEHQSTVNPNMPIRDLFYIADMYKAITMRPENDLYGSKLIKVPNPMFMVFYNGRKDAPERDVLRLSDAFENPTDNPELELTVQFVNINFGQNQELMDRCVQLRDYAILTNRVRENYDAGMAIREAATKAVDDCINDDIMRDFLIREKAGVIEMHVLDFNEEKHDRSLREEGSKERRIADLAQMLSRGGTEDDLRRFHDASDEEIAKAVFEAANKTSGKTAFMNT